MKLIPIVGVVIPILIVAFLAACGLALVLTPFARNIARRLGFVDHPDHRRVNTSPIPRAGGLATTVAFVAVAVVVTFLALNDKLSIRTGLRTNDITALLVGGVAAALLGFLDDILQLRARWQLVGQLAVAALAVVLGIKIGFINNPLDGRNLLFDGWIAAGLAMFWILGMINSINWIDGLDGLSSGIGIIAALTLGILSLTTQAGGGQPFIAVLCFALAGALLGFLRWNFHPASVFAGTSGTMFLGYTLALLAILGTAKVAVALLVLGVPIIDTFWIIVRRVASGRAPFSPDRGHIHHRLLDLGLSHRQTVVLIYAMCIGLAVLTFLLSGSGQLYAFLGLAILFGLGLFLATRGESGDALEATSYSQGQPPVGPKS